MRRRLARASAGEREAVSLLTEQGFHIEAAQVKRRYTIHVDGECLPVSLRADYVVTRGRQRLIAEVKTGRLAPRLDTPATRRQLLEYQHAFAVDGVLLVDADERSVRHIRFGGSPDGRRVQRYVVGACWVATLALAGLALSLHHCFEPELPSDQRLRAPPVTKSSSAPLPCKHGELPRIV